MADESAHASASEILTMTFYRSGQTAPLWTKLVPVICLFLSKGETSRCFPLWCVGRFTQFPWLGNDKCEGQTNAVHWCGSDKRGSHDGVVM